MGTLVYDQKGRMNERASPDASCHGNEASISTRSHHYYCPSVWANCRLGARASRLGAIRIVSAGRFIPPASHLFWKW